MLLLERDSRVFQLIISGQWGALGVSTHLLCSVGQVRIFSKASNKPAWLTPIIPAIQETEAGEEQVPGKPWQFSQTLSQKNKKYKGLGYM